LSVCTFFLPLCCLSFDLRILISSLVSANSSYCYIMERTSCISMRCHHDDDVRFVLEQYDKLYSYSSISRKHQSVGRHFGPLGHIILIPSQPVCALNPYCVLSRETTNTNVCLTRPDSTIYRSRGESMRTITHPLHVLFHFCVYSLYHIFTMYCMAIVVVW
jgi:hypothetical protein